MTLTSSEPEVNPSSVFQSPGTLATRPETVTTDNFLEKKGLSRSSITADYESPEDGEHRRELEKSKTEQELKEKNLENNHRRELEKLKTEQELKEKGLKDKHERDKEIRLSLIAGVIIMTVMILCIFIQLSPTLRFSEKEKASYQSILTIILAGSVGYSFGKNSSSESKK